MCIVWILALFLFLFAIYLLCFHVCVSSFLFAVYWLTCSPFSFSFTVPQQPHPRGLQHSALTQMPQTTPPPPPFSCQLLPVMVPEKEGRVPRVGAAIGAPRKGGMAGREMTVDWRGWWPRGSQEGLCLTKCPCPVKESPPPAALWVSGGHGNTTVLHVSESGCMHCYSTSVLFSRQTILSSHKWLMTQHPHLAMKTCTVPVQ